MKKYLLMILACGLIFTAYSQSTPGKWMIKKVGISLGQDMDMIQDMDADFMINSGKDTESSTFRDMDFKPEDLYGGFCENPHVRAMVTIGKANEDRWNIDLGVNAIFNRWDGLYYNNDSYTNGFWEENYDYYEPREYMSINSQSNELNFEATLNRKVRLYRQRCDVRKKLLKFNLYGGVGTNVGYAFGSQLNIQGANAEQVEANLSRSTEEIFTEDAIYSEGYEHYEQRDAFTQRVFATTGLGMTIMERLEVGMHLTRGVGYRAHFGAGAKMVNLHSLAFRANWVFGKKRCCVKK